MRQHIIGLSNGIHEAIRKLTIAIVSIMFTTVMLQIFARYIFSSPPVWTEDVARYSMVWLGLLGATLSFKVKADAVLVENIFEKSAPILKSFAKIVQTIAILAFTLPVIYFCFVGLKGGFAKGYLVRQAALTADAIGISMVWISISVPITMIIILIHLLARWLEPEELQMAETLDTQID